jgi:subtilisin family serine protease
MTPDFITIARRRARLAAALCVALGLTGAAHAASDPQNDTPKSQRVFTAQARDAVPLASGERGLFLVQFKGEPVARNAQLRRPLPGRPARLDPQSSEARSYAAQLAAKQGSVLAALSVGKPLRQLQTFTYAYNGAMLSLDRAQRDALAAHADVLRIDAVAALPIETDAGPRFIGAEGLWQGTTTNGAPGTRGEGRVIGVIDTGIQWGNPSFADVGADGYDHVNPLGAQHLGVCADAVPGAACNDKVIGAYALTNPIVQQINAECALPDPRNGELGLDPMICDALGVPLTDHANALDENGHGSHTASTAAGNVVDLNFRGTDMTISGVAPHANLIMYDACYTNRFGAGSCLTSATLAAVEQAVIDGVVDTLNYSIGGGDDPWQDVGSLAMLSAVDAGIFVAAAAGNSGPDAGTASHLEPWTATVAATTHDRDFAHRYSVTGPAPVPAELLDQPLFLGTAGSDFTQAVSAGTALIVSPQFDAVEDGCTAYVDENLFEAGVALVRRGGCTFAEKARNAQNAGAIAVLIANHQPGLLRLGGDPLATIPAFGITQGQGDALRDFVAAHADASIAIPLGLSPTLSDGDVMAGFSSRGPGSFDSLKPDLAAPGANILAAIAGAETPYGLMSGTSMATPHVAGAAALLRDLHPEWTVPELKSALMLTAKRDGVLREDALTPADAFDRGAGRIDLTFAARPGLVMDETPLRMMFADPQNGGDPAALNLPSLNSRACAETCRWTRRFRNLETQTVRYSFALAGGAGLSLTTQPAVLEIAAGATAQVEFTVDVTQAEIAQWHRADIALQPEDTSLPTLTVPLAVLPIRAEPRVVFEPAQLSVSLRAGSAPVTADVVLGNDGVRSLTWQHESAGSTRGAPLYSQLRHPSVGYGTPVGYFAPDGDGGYAADAFVLSQSERIGGLFADGFVFAPEASLAYSAVDFYIYADAFGVPAGNPSVSPELALWSYSAPLPSDGLDTSAGQYFGSIQLDLARAAQDVTLPAGKYWLVMAPHNRGVVGDGDRNWFWFGTGAAQNKDDSAQLTDPDGIFGFGTDWQAAANLISPDFNGLSFEVQGAADCTTPWLSAQFDAGSLEPGEQRTLRVAIDPETLDIGAHYAALCLATNDPKKTFATVPVRVDITGTPTSPTGVASVAPSTAERGAAITLRVAVTPGTWPDSTNLRVDADLSAIGASATQRLYDDGSNSDEVAGDKVFATSAIVGAEAAAGSRVLRATIRDDQGRLRRASATLLVLGGDEVFRDGFEVGVE